MITLAAYPSQNLHRMNLSGYYYAELIHTMEMSFIFFSNIYSSSLEIFGMIDKNTKSNERR